MTPVILLIILAVGAGLLVMVQDRRVEPLLLIWLSLGFAALIWQHLARSAPSGTAQILAAGAATGGITATSILGMGYAGRDSSALGFAPAPARARRVWRLSGDALLIGTLVGLPLLGVEPLLAAAILLLVGGTVKCLMADGLWHATAGLVVLLFGFHLLYLAMVSRVSILEMLLLDSLPIGATLVVASFHAALDAFQPAGQAPIDPDSKEPLE